MQKESVSIRIHPETIKGLKIVGEELKIRYNVLIDLILMDYLQNEREIKISLKK